MNQNLKLETEILKANLMTSKEMITIESDLLLETLAEAKEQGYVMLLDMTAIDNLHKSRPPMTRFELVYVYKSGILKWS